MEKQKITRRGFITNTATAAAAFTVVPRFVLGGPGYKAPSDKLNIVCIGVGGMGGADVRNVESENIVALCDVDLVRAATTFKRHPKTKKYKDFRIMLEKEYKHIDAVTVSTPDHVHAVAAMAAIKMDKHVYCQKPLAHDMFEVRALTEEARKRGVVTQMGVQIHATDALKLGVEMIKTGMIGKVHKIDLWSCKGYVRKDMAKKFVAIPKDKTPEVPIPDTLDWDLWLGPAPYRPYNPQYLPAKWRRWWDFGCGRLGDMACHIMDPAFWALDLKAPYSVEAHPQRFTEEIVPESTEVRWEFEGRKDQPPLTITWYDGLNRPFLPKEVDKDFELPSQGGLYYGDKGILLIPHIPSEKNPPILLPKSRMHDFVRPKQLFSRDLNHYQEWIKACKEGTLPSTNFDYSGPLTETVLLGNVAAKAGKRILWDSNNLNITNMPEANKYLKREYREGWSL
jgi:predicted dehydrogenase